MRDGVLTKEIIVSPGERSHEGGHREVGAQRWSVEEDRSGERKEEEDKSCASHELGAFIERGPLVLLRNWQLTAPNTRSRPPTPHSFIFAFATPRAVHTMPTAQHALNSRLGRGPVATPCPPE